MFRSILALMLLTCVCHQAVCIQAMAQDSTGGIAPNGPLDNPEDDVAALVEKIKNMSLPEGKTAAQARTDASGYFVKALDATEKQDWSQPAEFADLAAKYYVSLSKYDRAVGDAEGAVQDDKMTETANVLLRNAKSPHEPSDGD
jgi:hypothetical protein